MSERTHSVPADKNSSSKQKWALLLGGTVVAVLAAGVLLQLLRAERADAGAEQSAGQQDQPGEARVGGAPRQMKYMGKVGTRHIPYELVARECFNRVGKDVLENIINRMIIEQACEDRGIVVTEAEVNQEVVRIAQRFGLAVENWYQMLQIERNLSPQQYRRDIIWPMLALKKLAGDDITITEDDLQKAFIRDYGPRVKAKMIMLDNQRRATEVWEKAVANPENFSKLVREHSIDPQSRPLDGAIPPIPRFGGNENLEKAAFKLREGEVSGIIQVGYRYVILLCEGRTESTVKFDEVKDDLRKHLVEEKTQEAVARVFEQLKKEIRVDNYLTNTSTGGIQQASGTAAGNPAKPAAGFRYDPGVRPQGNRRSGVPAQQGP